MPVPDGVSLRDASAVFLQGLTAHYLACSTFPVRANTQHFAGLTLTSPPCLRSVAASPGAYGAGARRRGRHGRPAHSDRQAQGSQVSRILYLRLLIVGCCRVITTVSSESKARIAKDLGADHVIMVRRL